MKTTKYKWLDADAPSRCYSCDETDHTHPMDCPVFQRGCAKRAAVTLSAQHGTKVVALVTKRTGSKAPRTREHYEMVLSFLQKGD